MKDFFDVLCFVSDVLTAFAIVGFVFGIAFYVGIKVL